MRNTFSLLGVLLSLLAFGQSNCTFTIEGWVKDEHHNDILYGATVYIPALQRGVQVDSTGHFRLSNICPGTYVMVASHIGCEPERKTIEVGHSDLVLTFYLEHHTELLEEVQLQIEANSLQLSTAKQAQNRTQLSALELPELRMQSMGNSVQKPLINGLGGMRVETLQDGLSLQDQQWGSDHGLSLLLFPDDRVEVKQSGGLAGSVEIQSPDPSTLSNYVFLQGQSNGRGGAVGTQLALLQGPRF